VAPKANVVIVRTAGNLGLDIEQWPQVFQYIADFVSHGEQSGAAVGGPQSAAP
jgi:hypothetical protein